MPQTSEVGPDMRLVTALAMMVAAASPALADQTDPRLGDLFAQLHDAPSGDAARPLEARIWEIWLQPGNADVATPMSEGMAAMNAGEFDRAKAAFTRVVTAAPDFAEGWNKRATVLYLLGRYSDSIEDIDRVLALEPRHFGALSGLGLCNVQLDHDRAALEAFERAAAVDPQLSNVRENIEALKKKIARESI